MQHTTSTTSSTSTSTNTSTDSLSTPPTMAPNPAIHPVSRVFSDPLHHYNVKTAATNPIPTSTPAPIHTQSKAFIGLHHYTAATTTTAVTSTPTPAIHPISRVFSDPLHHYDTVPASTRPSIAAVHTQSKAFIGLHHYTTNTTDDVAQPVSDEGYEADEELPLPPQTFEQMGVPLYAGATGSTSTGVGSSVGEGEGRVRVAGAKADGNARRRKRDVLRRVWRGLF